MEAEQAPFSRKIFLLGALRVYQDGANCPLNGEKLQSLLAYLALHPRVPHSREKLADLLFAEARFERVRRNFSDTLYRLQKALGSEWLIIEGDTIALRVDEQLWVDVWEFERNAAGDLDANLKRAVDLYADELLPELYDEWLTAERELLRNQYLSTLENLAERQEKSGELRQALLTLRRLVTAEALHEPAHQAYLRVLGRLHRYGEALAHYEYLRALLRTELNAEPLAETRLIARSIERERDLATTQTEVEERVPFLGRKKERAALISAVEAMINGKGAIIAIEGEAGIGKSRLLREIAASVHWRGASLLQGTASETPSASPFSALSEALAPLINSPRGMQLETLLSKEIQAALSPLNLGWQGKVELSELPSQIASNRFFDGLFTFGETLARLSPTVLALDDLHWADPVVWKSLRVLGQGLARGGALMIVIYRRPEIEHTSGWEVVQDWDRAGIFKSISLPPLSAQEVAQLVEMVPSADPLEIHAWTGGNPFYIGEWLAAPGLNKIARQDTTSHRFESLSPTTRQALESAAVIGERIPYHLWTEISGLPSFTIASLADELVAHSWLQPSTAGYAFENDLIRAAVYRKIEPNRRRDLHERAANAYLSIEPDNLRARAFHLDQAGLNADAANAYRLAGEQDLARFAFREAQNALGRALALMPPDPTLERTQTILALVEACDATGDRARQQTALEEGLAAARNNDTIRLQILLAGARFYTHTGKVTKAEELLEEALALSQQLKDPIRETETITLFSNLAIEQGDWSGAQRWSLQALERARTTGDRSAEARALRHIGIVARKMGKPQESIQWLEKAIGIQSALGDRLQVSITQTNLLPAYNELGAWDVLITTAQELVKIKDTLGDRLGAAITRHNQALAYYALGDYVTARQILERVIQDSEAVLSRRRVGLARNVLGLVAEGEGKLEEALNLYRAALADAQAMNAVDEEAYVQHDLGVLLVRLHRPAEAVPLLEAARGAWIKKDNLLLRVKSEAFLGLAKLALEDRSSAEKLTAAGWAVFQAGVPVGEQPQDWLWALYSLLAALEQPEDAHAVLRAAYAELQRQGRAISHADLRRSFFERVPLNRDIVRAFHQLDGMISVRSVSLARRNAPLGRTLTQNEYLSVAWTLTAPEDEAIVDKSERRQYRLKRLLEEAEKQNAAPTDEDLAKALGVSRRTILRDMQALSQDLPRPPTRKRKS